MNSNIFGQTNLPSRTKVITKQRRQKLKTALFSRIRAPRMKLLLYARWGILFTYLKMDYSVVLSTNLYDSASLFLRILVRCASVCFCEYLYVSVSVFSASTCTFLRVLVRFCEYVYVSASTCTFFCEYLYVSASTCTFLRVRVRFCEYVYVSASTCTFLRVRVRFCELYFGGDCLP